MSHKLATSEGECYLSIPYLALLWPTRIFSIRESLNVSGFTSTRTTTSSLSTILQLFNVVRLVTTLAIQ